jgi:hypothetical protein
MWGLCAFGLVLALQFAWQRTMTPHVNPHPQKRVVVHGVFPYDRGWDLKITSSFYAQNERCKRTAKVFGIFPVADVARETSVEIPVTREEGDGFSFTYYEDYFEPGFCQWTQRFVSTRKFIDGNWQQGSDAIIGLNRQFNQINYQCHYVEIDFLPPRRKERSVVCGVDPEKPDRRAPQLTDNEVNFVWQKRVLYTHILSPGHSETFWKDDDKQ